MLAVGPSTILTGGKDSQWYYVSAPADGSEQSWKDLERIESQMSILALMPFLAQRTGQPTATAKAIDSVQANSEVQAWALILKDALELAFQRSQSSLSAW